MPLRYWRTYACALALGIGGLAMCAEECIRTGSSAKTVAKSKETPAPTLFAVLPDHGTVVVPPLTPTTEPKDTEPQIVLPMVPLTQPPVVIPASHTPEPPVVSKPTEPPAPPMVPMLPTNDLPPPPPPINLTLPTAPPATPMAPKFDVPPAPPIPSLPLAHSTPSLPTPPPAPSIPMPQPADRFPSPVPTPSVSSPTQPTTSAPQYKVFVRMGGTGQPRFEIRDGDQLLLKVTCEQIEMHRAQDGTTALPGLTAMGKVKFHGSGLDGTCDQLSVVSAKGEVSLKGGVQLSCYRGTTGSQVVAESVMFHLARTGEYATKSTKTLGSNGVVPASLPR